VRKNTPRGLPANLLEKDIWVTEILRLLYDEKMMGEFAIAFKVGTALSKCWKVIDRFSEDIDLSIHWADLVGVADEQAAWIKSTQIGKQ
jgi:predicted nucleotidyltransferase component of viral defense system